MQWLINLYKHWRLIRDHQILQRLHAEYRQGFLWGIERLYLDSFEPDHILKAINDPYIPFNKGIIDAVELYTVYITRSKNAS